IRKARRARLSVPVVQDGELTRIVAEAFVGEDLVRPRLRSADGEVRRSVTDDRVADEILQPRLGAANVGAKLPRALAIHVLMTIAMAGNLVTVGGNAAPDRRVECCDLSQR